MSRQQRTVEELLLDMGCETEEPWRYYHYRKPRKIPKRRCSAIGTAPNCPRGL